MIKFYPLTLVCIGCLVLSWMACGKSATEVKEKAKQDSIEKIRSTLLSYWASPFFATDDFGEQITGTSAELQLYNLSEGKLYFSLRKDLMDSTTLGKLTEKPDSVEFGKEENGKLVLGEYRLRAENKLFFRFPAHSFKVPDKVNLMVPFAKVIYKINEKELMDYLENRSVYGGKMYFVSLKVVNSQWVAANHGAMVAVKGEPSITRLANEITQNAPTMEAKIQQLLDFVTKEIPYNYKELNAKREILKRPNEVLMTKTSDCSGKTILFASLLEQIGAEYRLAYLEKHICVLVKEGKFKSDNQLVFNVNNEPYVMAETTIEGFQIGKTRIYHPPTEKEIQFIQKPEKEGVILEYPSGAIAKFEE